MAQISSLNFLPEVFRSSANQRFLGATVDQLIADPVKRPISGYIGRKFAPTYKLGDNYVPELSGGRQDYQLEPSVVIKDSDKNIVFNAGYIDLLRSVQTNNGSVTDHQKLFGSEYYNYDGHFDYDKFINYSDYYWMPNGPDSVNVTAGTTPYEATYIVTRNTDVGGYTFSTLGGHPNTQITLARGGTYKFIVDQPGNPFWIQSEPGITGTDPNVPTLTTRDVFGVKNNGTDKGTITFSVPQTTAQDFYTLMPVAGQVDTAFAYSYTKIQNRLLSDFLVEFPDGLDGVSNLLQNKTFIFVGNLIDDNDWTTPDLPAEFTNSQITLTSGGVVPQATRTGIWQLILVPTLAGDFVIQLEPYGPVLPRQKVFVKGGKTYASTAFWLENTYQYKVIPPITSVKEYLYYQDANTGDFTGEIKIVDNSTVPIDVDNDIVGQIGYTSPNGVIFTNGLLIQFDSLVTPSTYALKQYYVEGVGQSITLVPVAGLTVPPGLSSLVSSTGDYITINRASQDGNSWSATNRWFHKDVLAAAAGYNNQATINYGPVIQARRPIIEFEPDIQLWQFGRQAKTKVDLFITASTDAFAEIEGQITYTLDGVTLTPGLRIIFSNDYDINVTNNIYTVSIESINSRNFIRLVLTADDPVLDGETIFVNSGANANKIFSYVGATASWLECQAKTTFNQAPLFDLVDADGYSFGDTTMYPASTFAGTKFFGYATATGTNDSILGFPLKYQNFNNIGDIVFQNYYDTDSFTYTGGAKDCNSGYIKKNSGLLSSEKFNNWIVGVEPTHQYQVFTRFFDGHVVTINNVEYAFLQLDILPADQATIPYVKVYLNNKLLTATTDYQITKYGVYDVLLFTSIPAVHDKIDIKIYSNNASTIAYYEVPDNLNYNPLNENFDTVTLGQIRNHYTKLIENTAATVTGNRPLHDSYIKAQGGTLLQQSSPVVYATAFLNDPSVNFINAVDLARKEYTKFKNKFLSLCGTLTTIDYKDPVSGVDTILANINSIKNNSYPWYYSDMVPQGENYTTITYTVLNSRQTKYEISTIFNNTELSNRAILVYLTRAGVTTQLTVGVDYEFSLNSPAITFLTALQNNDTITLRDYSTTDGNYIPETPTKLGLFPKYVPEIYTDITYQTAQSVIRGHDGSITPAFGDFRDQYLLELERRIYNNIKADNNNNIIDFYDIIPGRFRKTEYTIESITKLLSQNFLSWVGNNNLDYTSNSWYQQDNPWTWNYAIGFSDVVDGSPLQGSWRAIYEYWFDTDTPDLTPWEMLGLSSKPTWWEEHYGPAPYTNGNTTLWEDLAAGYVWNGGNGNDYTDLRFARPGLTKFIPVDRNGNLLPPTDIPLSTQYNTRDAAGDYAVGQQGPVETAWRRSSDFPYALQVALALSKPAEYFGTQLDISRFYVNPVTGHISNVNNQKINPSLLAVNGDTTSGTVLRTSGYINWIADSIKNLGIDPVTKLNDYFSNLSVQLAYRTAGFTDQKLISVTAEQTSPGSTNASVLIPDENYQVYLNKSNTTTTVNYSAVLVEKTSTGYMVKGYDTTTPFFTITPSIANNNKTTISVNDSTLNFYKDAQATSINIPYGTVFSTSQQVVDFLISYERYLRSAGFVFDQYDQDLQLQRDFKLSAQEFAYWIQQGFPTGSIIVLNPVVDTITLNSTYSVVDEITNLPGGSRLLDQNFVPIKSNRFNIVRASKTPTLNQTVVSTVDGSNIAYGKFNLVQLEHVLIFDNVDDFGDIIYVPKLGNRQYRLGIKGSITGNWNGGLTAPGYVYSNPVISNWSEGVDYKLGDIVKFNNNYFLAAVDIPASQLFGAGNWTQIKSSNIQTGLLPSFGTNAKVFEQIYDIDNPPQDEMLQKFSAGLLGFRERSYLTDLGVNISNQTKFYQGYIRQKGTKNSIDALTRASFNNVTGNISIYEEWAFRSGTYGDIDNNKFTEVVLDQSVFTTNPVSLLLTDNYDPTNIVVNLAVTGNTVTSNVYNSSNIQSTSTSIYSNRELNSVYINDMPYAGYVNVNDIDGTIFDVINYGQVFNLVAGNKIWVAKDVNKAWNVYRVSETNLLATQLTYSLDNYARLTFNNPHSFSVGEFVIVKNFNPHWDGIYQVTAIPNQLSITIQIQDKTKLGYLISVSPAYGSGQVYTLTSYVIDSIKDVESVRPINDFIANEHVWVNNATDIGWGVYTFNRPWAANSVQRLTANSASSNALLGSTVAASPDLNKIYVGAPGSNSVQIFANSAGSYTAVGTIANTDSKFGTSIATAGNLIAVGAPGASTVHIYSTSNGISSVQTLHSPNANVAFGSQVAFNSLGNVLYVSDPTTRSVHAFAGNLQTNHWSWRAKVTANVASIATTACGDRLFVGAPTDNNGYVQNGNVYIYSFNGTAFGVAQTITSQYKNSNAGFGTSLAVDATGGNLFVGVPYSTISKSADGLVERWVYTGGQYVFNSNIVHPNEAIGSLGTSMSVSSDGQVLAVGSSGSTGEEDTTFDNNTTVIDAQSTKFIDFILNSGTVYTFEPVFDYGTPNDLGKYTYIQELSSQLHAGDQFGTGVFASRTLVVAGAPGTTVSSLANAGEVHVYANPDSSIGWTLTRCQELKVDINSINRTFIYNKKDNNILTTIDYVDPLKGKVLNAVAADIDYQRVEDPAIYNAGQGTSTDYHWGPDQVGKIWWNLDAVRYIDYEQDTLDYRLNHWGERFPGSEILVYEWVESSMLPSQYAMSSTDGTPLYPDDSYYSTYGYVDQAGNVKIKYYFWVLNKSTINTAAGKQNSVYSIAAAIENPFSQGVAYSTVLRNDAVALYNVTNRLVGTNSVLHLSSRAVDAGLIHSEYALVQEGNPSSVLPRTIQNKITDSLAGIDSAGNVVPDPNLTAAQAYGINIRPRQSVFVNRTTALANYIDIVNTKLAVYQVTRRKVLTTLNSSEAAPNSSSGQYVVSVADNTELTYVDTTQLSTGDSALVVSDTTQNSKWAIYTWTGTTWVLGRTQKYKTNAVDSNGLGIYWHYINWYATGYDSTVAPNITVATTLDLGKITLTPNTYVKVNDAGDGLFEIYYVDSSLNKTLVGIENGTIQISTGSIPGPELRQILIALKDEIFIDDLSADGNQIFFSMIKYALTEQKNLDWVFKTSFLSATQYLRKLEQFPSYIADNQTYYQQYINEVKPYRTILREFVVDYLGNDQYSGDVTDFDLPAYWDASLGVYRSPSGEQSYDDGLLSNNGQYQSWANNHSYSLVGITVDNPGQNYIFPPQIVLRYSDDPKSPVIPNANAYAVLNGVGGVGEIIVTTPGTGLTTTPNITINGSGTGAVASPILRNVYTGFTANSYNLVRSIGTTIKFDRTTYTNANTFVFWDQVSANNVILANTIVVNGEDLYKLTVTDWQANTAANVGTLIYYNGNTYTVTGNVEGPVFSSIQANANLSVAGQRAYSVTSSLALPIVNLIPLKAGDFNNANDRIIAFNGNIDLTTTTDGMSYPGVIVDGNTYVGTEYDAVVQSAFTDSVGVNPGDINIDGGAYISTFSTHAPQELVPGRMYDSLNLTVYDKDALSYRIFNNMNQSVNYYRIASNNSVTLTRSLALTDTAIQVNDATKLPLPDRQLNIPGVIFVNGEKIVYWRNYALETPFTWQANLNISVGELVSHNSNTYVTTGNIYDIYGNWANIQANTSRVTNFNTITQLRRAVDGTSPQTVHAAGSLAIDASVDQAIPGIFEIQTKLTSNTSYKVTDSSAITFALKLTAPISANVGDILTQKVTIDPWTDADYESNRYVYYNGSTYLTTGNILIPTVPWTPNTVFANATFISNGNVTYLTTGNVYASNFANIIANVATGHSKFEKILTSGNVSFAFAGNTITSVTMRAMDTISNSTIIPIVITNGSITNLPEIFDGTGFDVEAFDNTPGALYIQGPNQPIPINAYSFVRSASILGEVDITGYAAVKANSTITSTRTWYTPGPVTATNGRGLINSATPQANFLKASRGFTPVPGTTP